MHTTGLQPMKKDQGSSFFAKGEALAIFLFAHA